ncbi:uncharacterized protein BO88DRAFT_66524 [Aspergillus vadensis CBS 113365]|uniref:Uncharacterized protein n=1 Tax=Aspergillus vadensis (strain CBS 113365 / IMI 142717 / IBT 24658) TaxID=1448311 RepID=A0A319B5W3_ASPVC|nr:hypothetical protein BO88DRAFT_66524 [Aspergillus vadensis CBS 113365]PYH68196.1 hypothetical protein BO88DRAFT_66524 [Aspergillus vadensis CBS 113365]
MAWLGFFVRKDKIPMRLSCGGGGTLHSSFKNFVLYVEWVLREDYIAFRRWVLAFLVCCIHIPVVKSDIGVCIYASGEVGFLGIRMSRGFSLNEGLWL